MILLTAALLPAIVLMVYVYRKDTVEKEPPRLVLRLFVLGAVAGPIAGIVENIAFAVFDRIIFSPGLLLIVDYFIGVALVEEALKYLVLSTVRNNREFNYVFDGVVYAVAASLGFAALENVMYVFDGGIPVAISRAIFSVPGHCAGGVVMGCFYGLAKHREYSGKRAEAKRYYVAALVLPVIEHGFYDAALSAESDVLVFLALAVEIAFIAFAMVLVKKTSRTDQRIPGTQSTPGGPSGTPPVPPMR